MVKQVLLFLLLIVLFSCQEKEETAMVKTQALIITIQPFSDIPDEEVNYVYSELHKVYPNLVIAKKMKLPQSAYYKPRNRYRADSLIRYLRSITPVTHVTIGLTSKDISHTKGDMEDYGIMGLGYRPGNACVVSTFRVSKENKLKQFFKFCIHELGHTAGLDHCPEKTCFMRDAEGGNPSDEEVDFCPGCKSYLMLKGWNLKQ
jgi:archaemetzincin